MAPPHPVKILEVCRVAPPPTSPDSAVPTSLPLTFFDVFWLRFHPNKRLFFYETSIPTATFSETILPKLKHSLSLTLQHYLPVAGNLTGPPDSDKPILQHLPNDAVSLTVAESESDFHHLSGDGFRETKQFYTLLPNFPSSDTKVPVMALQITLFPNIGFCIGYATHHVVLDGKSISMFMHSWASITRLDQSSTLKPELIPSYDRTRVTDPDGLEKTYLNGWLNHNGPNNRSLKIWELRAPNDSMLGTFHLTTDQVKTLKNSIHAHWREKLGKELPFHLSTFTVTSAYVWVCLARARKSRREKEKEKVGLAINIDCRARLEPPVPSTYFGNCVTAIMIELDLNQLNGEDAVSIAAKATGEDIEALKGGVLRKAKDLMSAIFSVENGELYSTAGSHRFELYDTDFGFGRPKKVELISIDKSGAFSLSDCRDSNGGVEIGVVLNRHETEAFASLFDKGLEKV